MVEQGTRKA
ncbi:hypothetical protein SPV_2500 [Streptococcus pneumoniae]|nr:hypothetical protein SPV_2500 [Streptococcus pneumoniae]